MSEFRFGHPEQYEVGSIFESRKALSDAGIHGPPMHGIWGRQREGACSIVMSGGYVDDVKIFRIREMRSIGASK